MPQQNDSRRAHRLSCSPQLCRPHAWRAIINALISMSATESSMLPRWDRLVRRNFPRRHVLARNLMAVQHPAEQAEVALVFIDDRGTGKGTLGKALCKPSSTLTASELTRALLFGDECYGPK